MSIGKNKSPKGMVCPCCEVGESNVCMLLIVESGQAGVNRKGAYLFLPDKPLGGKPVVGVVEGGGVWL